MTADRIVFAVIVAAALPVLGYSFGYEHGQSRARATCEQQPGERLFLTEQHDGFTLCHYAAEPYHGMAKRTIKKEGGWRDKKTSHNP